jgi:uncharacterized membrane protein
MDGSKSFWPIFQRNCQGVLRALATALFILAGANHFRNPQFYRSIVPPSFPAPMFLVAFSGICEIAGGAALQVRRLRRVAGWGLIALLIAVFPANIYMAMHPDSIAGLRIAHWLLWVRLPLQGVLVVWVWYVSGESSQ